MIGIYKLTNKINGKIYIGQSDNIERRWQQERNDAYNENKTSKYSLPISIDIRLFGWDNFNKEVVEECSKEQLNEREAFWIKYYNCLKPNGYNSALIGHQITERTTDILFEYHQEIKNLIRNTNKSLRDIAITYSVSLSTIEDINQGRSWVDENLSYPLRVGNRRGRVAQLYNGIIINIYNSISEASNINHLDNSSISKVCKGQRKSCGGYQWIWID